MIFFLYFPGLQSPHPRSLPPHLPPPRRHRGGGGRRRRPLLRPSLGSKPIDGGGHEILQGEGLKLLEARVGRTNSAADRSAWPIFPIPAKLVVFRKYTIICFWEAQFSAIFKNYIHFLLVTLPCFQKKVSPKQRRSIRRPTPGPKALQRRLHQHRRLRGACLRPEALAGPTVGGVAGAAKDPGGGQGDPLSLQRGRGSLEGLGALLGGEGRIPGALSGHPGGAFCIVSST